MPDTSANPSRGRILIIGAGEELTHALTDVLVRAGYLTYARADAQHAFEIIYSEPPDAILLAEPGSVGDLGEFPADLKGDTVFNHLPIIALLSPQQLADAVDWSRVPVDDYVALPFDPDALLQRIAFTLARTHRDRGYNPLTRLPGNDSIVAEIQNRLDARDECAIIYADLDYFKAFNDDYGFARGDEVLRMLARVLVNAVRPSRARGGYVGHIGGDDFVLVLPLADAEGTCAQIIGNFELIVPTFYNEADRIRGYIVSQDRTGRLMQFPLMTLTLAVVPNQSGRLHHFGEVSSIAAELKKYAKSKTGSNYVIDRRRTAPGARAAQAHQRREG